MKNVFPSIPDYSNLNFLVTGGAGFIGSHVCDFLVEAGAKSVVILDNLSTGDIGNIQHLIDHKRISFVEADITSLDACLKVSEGANIVVHLAALGSVPRSIANPIATHEANSTGFVNMLWASNQNKVMKFIYASSSSVYGDTSISPKKEGHEGVPLSPYAVTKKNNEVYAKLFAELYGIETIGLRFFNIFGPRQKKDGPYAAFLALVFDASQNNLPLKIFGDGKQSRDFTFVANAVWAISCAIKSEYHASGLAFNIGCGHSSSLLEIIELIEEIEGTVIKTEFFPERKGDVRNSLADLTSSSLLLGYEPIYSIKEGLINTLKEFNN